MTTKHKSQNLINEKALIQSLNSSSVQNMITKKIKIKIDQALERVSVYDMGRQMDAVIEKMLSKSLEPYIKKYVEENKDTLMKALIKKRLK